MAQCPGTRGPVSLSTSTTSIAQEAFRACSRITELTIPSGVTFIGQGAFMLTSALSLILFTTGLTVIGNEMFLMNDGTQYPTLLASVTIPSTITFFGQ
jgi:hypothetical protein